MFLQVPVTWRRGYKTVRGWAGGRVKSFQKVGPEKVLAMLKGGGGHNTLLGSFEVIT